MERQPTTDRMIQEYVPGKQVTLAHLIANPGKDLFKKLGLPDAVSAIGILIRRGDLFKITVIRRDLTEFVVIQGDRRKHLSR